MELWEQAYKDYISGMKYQSIADKYDVTINTVKSWKTRHWNNKKCAHKNKKSMHTKSKKVCTQKQGAPKGNQNAVGDGAPTRNKNARKHGVFESIYYDSLDDEERYMIEDMPSDEEFHLIKQIEMFSVRERKILRIINEYRNTPGGLAISAVTTTKRELGSDKKKKDKCHITTTTGTESTNSVVCRWENELTRVQRAKTQCIAELTKLRLERTKHDENLKGNETVDDWVMSVMEAGDGDE